MTLSAAGLPGTMLEAFLPMVGKLDSNTIMGGAFSILFGLYIALFSSRLARDASNANYELFGKRFSERIYGTSFLVAGLLFISFGTLALLGIIRFRP